MTDYVLAFASQNARQHGAVQGALQPLAALRLCVRGDSIMGHVRRGVTGEAVTWSLCA
jgi:hypothetical protein